MTEASLEDSLSFGSDIEVGEPTFPDHTLITSAIALANSIHPSPMRFSDFQTRSENLSLIGQNLDELFSAPGTIHYDLDSRKNLQKIICSFIYGIVNESKDQSSYLSMKDLTTSKNSKSSSINFDFEKSSTIAHSTIDSNSISNPRMTKFSSQYEQNKGEFAKLNQKIASLHTETYKNNIETAQEKFEANLTISAQNAQIESLKEQISLLEKDKNDASIHAEYQHAIQSKDEVIDRLAQKISHLKNKILAQGEIIHKLQDQHNADKMTIHKLKADNQDLEYKVSTKVMKHNLNEDVQNELNKAHKRISELQKTVTSLSGICESQASDICEAREINHRSFELLNEQNVIIDGFHAYCTNIENEKQKLNSELSSLRQSNQKNIEQIGLSENARLQSEKIVNEVQKMLNEYFNSNIQNITETLQVILAEGDPLMKQKNRKLKQIIKGQIHFLQHFAETGEINNICIDPTKNIKGSVLKDTALVEISHIRKYIKENELLQPDDMKYEEGNSENHLSFQIAINEILRKECEKHKNSTKVLAEFKNSFGFKEGDNMVKIIHEKLKMCTSFMNDITNILKIGKDANRDLNVDINKDFNRIAKRVLEFIQQSLVLQEIVDGKLRHSIRFEGDLIDVPVAAVEIIKKLKKTKTKEIQSMKSDTSELRKALEVQRAQLAEMKNSIKVKDAEISNLKIEKVNVSSEFEQTKMAAELDSQSLRSQNQILVTQLAAANSKIENLTHENISIQKKLDENQREFSKKLKITVQEEVLSASATIDNVRKEAREIESKLKDKLRLCSQRIQVLKAKNTSLVNESAETAEKQRQIIDSLKSQNEELSNQISIIKREKEVEIRDKVDETRAVILSLQSEKRSLKSEVSALSSRCQQIEAAKDSYWKAQVSSVESQLRAFNKARSEELHEQHIAFLHRAASTLIKYVPRFGELSDESFISYLQKVGQSIGEYEVRLQQLQNRFLRNEMKK